MAQINFPVATQDGQVFEAPTGVVYTYVGTPPNGYWSGTFQSPVLTDLDTRYLKLDSSNDPLTDGLEVRSGSALLLQLDGNAISTTFQGEVVSAGSTERLRLGYRTGGPNSGLTCGQIVQDTNALYIAGRDTVNGDIIFHAGSGVPEVMRIDATNGKVGIGTDNPNQKLEVAGNSQHRIAVTATDTTMSDGADYGGYAFFSNDSSNPNRKNWDIYQVASGTTGTTNLAINSHAASDIVRITSTGNVGIGTSSPDTNFQVVSTVDDSVESTKVISVGARGTSPSIRQLNLYAPGPDSDRVAKLAVENTAAPFVIDVNGSERVRVKGDGVINFASCPTYADDSAAGTGGLVAGDIYKTSAGDLKIKL